MSALRLKLFRELRRLWAQVLAIALVMAAGVATLIIGVGTYGSLAQTRAHFYEASQFADLFATVTRAPRSLLPRIAEIDGVLAVDARIANIAVADVAAMKEPASVLLISLPPSGSGTLNRLYLRSGRLPEPGDRAEAVVSEVFAKAQHLAQGSSFRVLLNGALRQVTVTGVALSPEYIYALSPGEILPDERRFGVVWMPERQLAAAYGLEGAFSTVAVKLLPGASQPAVIARLDRLLAPYGGQGAYPRERQASHSYLDAELTQLRSLSEVLPPVFLLVAAFLVNMTLSRLIAVEREEIGLLKALGYSSLAIAWHYVEFVLWIAAIGIAIGFGMGLWLGNQLTVLYARFFSFPELVFSRDMSAYVIAGGVTLGAAVVGALRAVRQAAWLPPAVAMLPPSPPSYRRATGFRWPITVRKTTLMTARHLLRWPLRTFSGIVGVALAVAILVGSLWTVGAIEFMIDQTFNQTDRQDASINFLGPRPMSALFAVARLPGVLEAEPYRYVAVEIAKGQISRRIALNGRPADAQLTQIVDTSRKPVILPESGIVLSKALADILHAGRGDTVDTTLLEGDRRSFELRVAAIVEGYLGLTAYLNLDALNRLLGDGDLISGANIAVDTAHQDELFAMLKQTPSAGHVALQSAALRQFRATMAQNMFMMITVLVGLAAMIAFGVVYSFSRISLSEQGREMASLRVLGFTRSEVSGLLLAEIGAVVIVAQPLGWLLGTIVAFAMVKGYASEIYRMPLVLGPDVYAYASLVVFAAALLSGLVVRARIDRLDMIAVLKTRE
jgi:putative ABC transport system permease protein